MAIRLFTTGGTIDKNYNPLNGELEFNNTHLQNMLTQGNATIEVVHESLMTKDSLDMTEEDRAKIVKACKDATEDKIVITHGTDTMVETALAIAAEVTDKTIVLVGAMIPYSFGGSDALFNLGTALTAVQLKEPGVYITMNGKIFDADKVQKNKEKGVFEEK